ncbi:hypothetical protein CKQ90_32550, partial [Klebsiella pneumoniae]
EKTFAAQLSTIQSDEVTARIVAFRARVDDAIREWSAGSPAPANVRLQVEGLSGELEKKRSPPSFPPSRAMKSRPGSSLFARASMTPFA